MKIVVAHEGKRDEYQVAQALLEAGHEVTLITSAYGTPTLRFFSRFLPLKGLKRIANRHTVGIEPTSLISCFWTEIFARLLGRIFGEPWAQEMIDRTISNCAAIYLKESPADAVIAYNYSAFDIFDSIPYGQTVKIIFQCHPHPSTVVSIMSRLMGEGALPRANKEREFNYSAKYRAKLFAEPLLADFSICASSFSASSLVRIGLDRENIKVIPYGHAQVFDNIPSSLGNNDTVPLKIIFVGQFVYRKGFTVIWEILNALDFNVHIDFVGRGLSELDPGQGITNELITHKTHWNISQTDLIELYKASEVFLFPSFVEGFGHVILEAMGAGCAPIVSCSTCGPDVIHHGISGYTFDNANVEGFSSAIRNVHVNRSHLYALRRAAHLKATEFSWEKFRMNLVAGVLDFQAKKMEQLKSSDFAAVPVLGAAEQ